MPHIGLTTDLIVAFPGESEQDFGDTLSLVEEVRFDSAFTFIYSPRTGTKAAGLPDRVPPETAKDRITRLIAKQEDITRSVFASLIGTADHVLAEGVSRRDGGQLTGKTGRSLACNFPGPPELIGQIVPVRITGQGSNTLKAERIERKPE